MVGVDPDASCVAHRVGPDYSSRLTGALELEGAFDPGAVSGLARKTLTSPSTPLLGVLDAFRYNVVPSRAGRHRFVVDVLLSDSGERARLELRHSVLRVDKTADDPHATLSLPKDRFLALASITDVLSMLIVGLTPYFLPGFYAPIVLNELVSPPPRQLTNGCAHLWVFTMERVTEPE